MINKDDFKDLIREVVRDELGDRTRYKIAEIASVGDKVSVIFSGEQEPTQKQYTYLKSYYPKVGDRVWLAKDTGTYVVLGKIDKDVSTSIDLNKDLNINGDLNVEGELETTATISALDSIIVNQFIALSNVGNSEEQQRFKMEYNGKTGCVDLWNRAGNGDWRLIAETPNRGDNNTAGTSWKTDFDIEARNVFVSGKEVDSVVSQGNNGNGNWIRYTNGIQICWSQNYNLNTGNSQSHSVQGLNIYRISNYPKWTFPQPFINHTYSAVATYGRHDTEVEGNAIVIPRVYEKAVGHVGIQLTSISPFNSGRVYSIDVIAIGKWK